MVQKRAPGGGRKPLGEFKGKTATLTTRITPQTRTALERRAKEHGRSLSQEIELCLNETMRPDRGHLHVGRLADAITLVIQTIERATQRRWIEDRFTCEAVGFGIETLLSHFAPQGAPEVPSSVAEASTRLPAQLADGYRTPEGLAQIETFGLITQIETVPEPHEKISPGIHYPEEWYAYWRIRRDIGAASAAKRKNWKNKETGQ